jgi:hypothetical protein
MREYAKFLANGGLPYNFKKFQPFVKTEKMPLFAQRDGDYGVTGVEYVARLIQAPHDSTHIVAGRYLKPLLGRLKEIWHEDNWLFYASVNPKKLDHWLARNKHAMTWFWADYSAFDATYTKETWDMIEGFYRVIYPDAELEFWQVLEAWRKPGGSIKFRKDGLKFKYQAGVCNASGRDDTALANALVNGVVLSISLAAALAGVETTQVTHDMLVVASQALNIAVVGDDSLVACHFDVRPLMDTINKNIRSFGLVVKAESSADLLDVTFLGMMPYPVAGEFYWGPTLGRRLYKAFWQEKPVGNLPAWTRGVATQLLCFPHVPILYDMALKVDQLLEGMKRTQMAPDQHRVWAMRTDADGLPHYDESTLRGLSHRYRNKGLTPGMIARDIGTIQSIERLPALVRLHTTDAALEVDDL